MSAAIDHATAIADFICNVESAEWRGVTVEEAEADILPRFPGVTSDDFAAGILIVQARLQVEMSGGGRA